MTKLHKAYLSLGSNINPEANLRRAIKLLKHRGQVLAISSAWESKAIGSNAPNYLNACLIYLTGLTVERLRSNILRPIETELGRTRSGDKFAPRPIDIDLIAFDETAYKMEYWNKAFLLVPLSQIAPDFINPLTNEPVLADAEHEKVKTWIVERTEVLTTA